MNNRKVLNATPTIAKDGTEVKSKVEKMVYETLLDLGYEPKYESETFTYWKGRKPKTLFYDIDFRRKNRLNMKKLIDAKYTPDIIFMYDDIKVIIEIKGFENDVFPLKKKMFRGYLDTLPYPVVYAEIFTKKQLMQFLEELRIKAPEIKEQKRNMIVKRKVNNCKAFFFTGENLNSFLDEFNQRQSGISMDEYLAEISYNERILVKDETVGEFYLPTNHWLVKDLENGLCFVMNDAQFKERYDIISE